MRKSKLNSRAMLMLALAVAPLLRAQPAGGWAAQQGEAAVRTLDRQGLYRSLQEAVAAARFAIRREDAAWRASNPAQQYDASFTAGGLDLAGHDAGPRPGWRAAMRFLSYGYGVNLAPAGTPELAASGNRIEYRRRSGPVTEWYVNQSSGLEQGFTIAYPPGAKSSGERLRLVMEVTGDLRAGSAGGTEAVALTRANGEYALSYGSLFAHDATGRELPSSMQGEGRSVVLEVNDDGAEYPLTIDPLFHIYGYLDTYGDLLGYGSSTPDHFGYSVAISGDTAVVGSPDYDGSRGAAYVFVLVHGYWYGRQILTATAPAAHDAFGRSVAVQGDTIVVGAPNDDDVYPDQGSVYVFIRNGSVWQLQQQIFASNAKAGDLFGYSVAIDAAAGNTIVAGAPRHPIQGHADQGAAYVFVRDGNSWSQQQMLFAYGMAGDNFGWSVSVERSTAGTIVVGAPHGGGHGEGQVDIFIWDRGYWYNPWSVWASDPGFDDQFGHSVSISAAGDRFVVGAPFDDVGANADRGSAYVFQRSTDVPRWKQLAKLTSADGAAGDRFGWSVAINGSDVVVGAPYDDIDHTDQGSAYVFECLNACSQANKLISTDYLAMPGDLFGMSVALDASGTNRLLVGAPWADRFSGRPFMMVQDIGSVFLLYR